MTQPAPENTARLALRVRGAPEVFRGDRHAGVRQPGAGVDHHRLAEALHRRVERGWRARPSPSRSDARRRARSPSACPARTAGWRRSTRRRAPRGSRRPVPRSRGAPAGGRPRRPRRGLSRSRPPAAWPRGGSGGRDRSARSHVRPPRPAPAGPPARAPPPRRKAPAPARPARGARPSARRTSERANALTKVALSRASFTTGSSVPSRAASPVALRRSALKTLTGGFFWGGGSGSRNHRPAPNDARREADASGAPLGRGARTSRSPSRCLRPWSRSLPRPRYCCPPPAPAASASRATPPAPGSAGSPRACSRGT